MLALMPHTAPTSTASASFDNRLPMTAASATAKAMPMRMIPFRITTPISDFRLLIFDSRFAHHASIATRKSEII
jgi:hypothetical protein